MYEVLRFKGKVTCIKRLHDGACIPLSEDNSDYVRFIKWQSEQSEQNKLNLSDETPPAKTYEESRREAYLAQGLSHEELIVALWENIVEGKSERVQELQALRNSIKLKFPKE